MRSLFRSAAFAAALLALPASAAADRGAYAGLGLGMGAGLEGDYSAFSSEGHASGRLFGGYRFGPWSVEAAYFGYGFERRDGASYTLTSWGLTGKYHLTFGHGIEWYVRLGLDKASLNAPRDPDGTRGAYHDFTGIGIDYGTGVSWQSQPLGTARLKPRVGGFLDLGVQRVGTTRDGATTELNGSFETIQVGQVSPKLSSSRTV
jgi:hypothetical protein